jgi:hypothetical protein
MRRPFSSFLVLVLLAPALAIAGLTAQPAGAQADESTVRAANRVDINNMHLDFLGRAATEAELSRYEGALGTRFTEHDLSARVMGSTEAFENANRNIRRWINTASREVAGETATRTEFRELRRLYRTTDGKARDKRRAVVSKLLTDNNYDPDGFSVDRLNVKRRENGSIRWVTIGVSGPVVANELDVQVTIDNTPITGDIELRENGTIIRLRPDVATSAWGSTVATVLAGPARNFRADLSQTVNRSDLGLFPDIRVVAYYGNHQTSLLGVLGETGPVQAAARVKAAAEPFSEPGRPAVGAFELIATVAQGSAGADGNYSHPSRIEDLKVWIDVAREEGLYVILDIQPGRSDFFTESIRYEELLLEPHVGLALDPEWRMGPTQRPGQLVGSVTAAEVNRVSDWLSDLVIDNDLPEKMFILHQFQSRMIKNRDDLIDRPGLATIIHADGFGGRAIKLQTYGIIQAREPFWNGFKLFIDEDTNIFRPADVLDFTTVPVPDLITYQ